MTARVESAARRVGELWEAILDSRTGVLTGPSDAIYKTTPELRDALSRLSGWLKDEREVVGNEDSKP